MNVRELFDLTGKTAIVTGGATGLGFQAAEALAELGANVVICGRKLERCEIAAAEISTHTGATVIGVRCDVGEPTDIEPLVLRTLEEFGGLDILVNNAGTSWGAPAIDHPLEAWEKVIRVNLTGLFAMAQAAARVMQERGGGKIVNLSSSASFSGLPAELMDAAAYTASKGGVNALTKDLAVKWAPLGITVNAIAPGWFPSDMSRVTIERNADRFLDEIPLRRFGGPHDLKGAVAFLCSAASDFVTGTIVSVDGGQTAR